PCGNEGKARSNPKCMLCFFDNKGFQPLVRFFMDINERGNSPLLLDFLFLISPYFFHLFINFTKNYD
ncbi:hypothetical protein, partial [Brachyspira catarrhinii]|uniref:hypothetical protein n=1 Tax=Brachyspira catarrhinii TaxID=2528966 RepID=UPI001F15765A